MENKKTFFKKCPVRGCRAISGFCLTIEEIKENGVYYCQNCQKETKLSKWTISNIREYNKLTRDKTSSDKLEKLQNSRMTNIIPANKRKYGRQ